MANAGCLNRRLLLAVLRAPSPLSANLYRHQHAIKWVRTITSTSFLQQGAPAISFGADNDAVIAQYMSGSGKKNIKSKKAGSDKSGRTRSDKSLENTIESSELPAVGNDYEINGFIDRSKPKRKSQKIEGATQDNAEHRSSAASPNRPKIKKPNELEPRQLKLGKGAGGEVARRQQGLRRNPMPDLSQPRPKLDKWAEQKNGLREKFPEGWNPRKKLSPDAMEGIRGLHQQDPMKYTTPVLAEQFKVSPEAIRRILKSKWLPRAGSEKMEERRERWAKRHDRIWDTQAELGLRPRRNKERDIEDPEKFEKEMVRKEILGDV